MFYISQPRVQEWFYWHAHPNLNDFELLSSWLHSPVFHRASNLKFMHSCSIWFIWWHLICHGRVSLWSFIAFPILSFLSGPFKSFRYSYNQQRNLTHSLTYSFMHAFIWLFGIPVFKLNVWGKPELSSLNRRQVTTTTTKL